MRATSMGWFTHRRLRRCLPGMGRRLLAVAIGALVASQAARAGEAELLAGPLWQDIGLTLEPGTGEEGFGPLYYRQDREDEVLWAVPPVVSALKSKDGEKGQWFVLPPVFSWRRYGEDTRWQFFQLLNGSRMETIRDPEVRRINLFPFFLYQDAPDQERSYWSLFPIYGTVRNRLYRDEIQYAAFPLWMTSRKGTMTTHNVLFPFLHLREGPGLRGWQFWPFVGHEHLEPSTRTNLADVVEPVPGHDKTFVLWPIGFHNRTGLGTDNEGRVDAVLPLFYRERTPKKDHTSVGWPFISWTEDREQKYHQWNAPWPLVGFARGEGKTLDRVLPLFSVGRTPTLEAQTYLWPLYRRRHLHTESIDRDRRQFAVFLYSDLKERNFDTGKSARRIDAWPFFSWTRDTEGRERLQALSLLDPLRRGAGLERNWAPLWALWRDEWNPATGAESQSLLWNLYRREARPGVTKGSLLFGLVQYQSDSAGRRWRWLHLGPRLAPVEAPADTAHDVPKPR